MKQHDIARRDDDDTLLIDATGATLDDLVLETDTGPRKPSGFAAGVMVTIAIMWSLFHIWVASPLPYTKFFALTLDIPVLSSTYQRYFHLAFAFALAFSAYPMTRKSPRRYIPWYDCGFALLAVAAVMYLYVLKAFYPDITMMRSGAPNLTDICVSVAGIALLMEAARRSLGPPIIVIAALFLLYTLFGNMSFIPELIQHKGQSISKLSSYMWITEDGIFGTAIGVSNDYVFLFVLFGALLEKAGAGNYFIQLAFSLLGHLRGGPAKAAVVSSAMTGLISGSSIANVVTTGTFTVPLMRKVGFSREKAGAVEVSSSVNGQIMPPVMGAAAFLMAEYTGVPYVDIVKHAFIPAAISYIALVYIVHLEAKKSGMLLLEKAQQRTVYQSALTCLTVTSALMVFAGGVYYTTEWLKPVFGHHASFFFAGIIGAAYCALLAYACRFPALCADAGSDGILPDAGPTFKTGLHFLLPIIVMIWCLMVEQMSPGLSAFWATAVMLAILFTQRQMSALFRLRPKRSLFAFVHAVAALTGVLLAYICIDVPASLSETSAYLPFVAIMTCGYGAGLPVYLALVHPLLRRKQGSYTPLRITLSGFSDVKEGLVAGARNMTGIAVATAAAGIIVGSVSITGIGQALTAFIEMLSGGSFFLALVFTAVLCIILGMGLPTTANYIMVSTLMAGVLVELAGQAGIVLPIVAAHMFVFYYGIMADVTPPVGLASFAAAAVSGGDPIRTGIQAFIYSIRTVILPFLFIYNTNLLLIGDIDTLEAIWVFVKSTIALLIFTAATQHYMIVRNKLYESMILLIVAFSLFYPMFWVDKVTPPFIERSPKQFNQILGRLPEGERIKVRVNGFDDLGDPKNFYLFIDGQAGDTPEQRISRFNLTLREDGNRVLVDDLGFNSPAEKAGFDFDVEITEIHEPQSQGSKIWVYAIAFFMFSMIYRRQKKRERLEIFASSE